jgi:hypothetical protein
MVFVLPPLPIKGLPQQGEVAMASVPVPWTPSSNG